MGRRLLVLRWPLLPCRDAVADPHGPDCSANQRDSPVVLRHVVDVPVLLVVRVPQLQVVVKTVFIPHLQIVVKIDAIHESFALACFVMPVLVLTPVEIPQLQFLASFVMPVVVSTPVEIPQVQFLACFVMPVVVPRAVEIPQVQFSGKVVVPVLCNDSCVVRWCYNCGGPAVAVHRRSSTSLWRRKGEPLGQSVQNYMEIPQLPYMWWSMSMSRCGRRHPCRDAKRWCRERGISSTHKPKSDK